MSSVNKILGAPSMTRTVRHGWDTSILTKTLTLPPKMSLERFHVKC